MYTTQEEDRTGQAGGEEEKRVLHAACHTLCVVCCVMCVCHVCNVSCTHALCVEMCVCVRGAYMCANCFMVSFDLAPREF